MMPVVAALGEREECLQEGRVERAGLGHHAVAATLVLAGVGAVLGGDGLEGRARGERIGSRVDGRVGVLLVRRGRACAGVAGGGRHEDDVHGALLGRRGVGGDRRIDIGIGGRCDALLGGQLALVGQVDEVVDGRGGDVRLGRGDVAEQRIGVGGAELAGGQGGADAAFLLVEPEELQLAAIGPLVLGDAGAADGGDRLPVLLPEAVADADHDGDDHRRDERDEADGDPHLEALFRVVLAVPLGGGW